MDEKGRPGRPGRPFLVRRSGTGNKCLDRAGNCHYHENDFQNHFGAAPLKSLLRRIDKEIAAIGGKRSRSRARVMETFFRAGRHVTVEELTLAVRRSDRTIGAATVYRTLKLLSRLGYAQEVDFGEGVRRYESKLSAHHDHLVCRSCGTVSEFEEPAIEELQALVAMRQGFRATAHRLEIYGICRRCGDGESAPRESDE